MKPIILRTDEVRAILDERKTMIRRVIKPQTVTHNGPDGQTTKSIDDFMIRNLKDAQLLCLACAPYKPGDILFVRETWAKHQEFYNNGTAVFKEPHFIYKADGIYAKKWNSPVSMPKEAARILLRVTNVRVERVQDISPKDCYAEGIIYVPIGEKWAEDGWAVAKYAHLWNKVNEKRGYGWYTNPWVWAYEFERAEN